MNFNLILQALQVAAAAADAAVKARAVYDAFRDAAQQSGELTPEQSAELDAKAEVIFSGPAGQLSGR